MYPMAVNDKFIKAGKPLKRSRKVLASGAENHHFILERFLGLKVMANKLSHGPFICLSNPF